MFLWVTKLNRVSIQLSLLFVTLNINKWKQPNLHKCSDSLPVSTQKLDHLYLSFPEWMKNETHSTAEKHPGESFVSWLQHSICLFTASTSGDSIYRAEMIAAILQNKPLQTMSQPASAKNGKGRRHTFTFKISRDAAWTVLSGKAKIPKALRDYAMSNSTPVCSSLTWLTCLTLLPTETNKTDGNFKQKDKLLHPTTLLLQFMFITINNTQSVKFTQTISCLPMTDPCSRVS